MTNTYALELAACLYMGHFCSPSLVEHPQIYSKCPITLFKLVEGKDLGH